MQLNQDWCATALVRWRAHEIKYQNKVELYMSNLTFSVMLMKGEGGQYFFFVCACVHVSVA